jgi:hypothetical protein
LHGFRSGWLKDTPIIRAEWPIASLRDLLDVKHEKTDRTKGLFLASLRWESSGPVVAPFA